jgi:pimeloyl-ACP methyl ester carboxylesterase
VTAIPISPGGPVMPRLDPVAEKPPLTGMGVVYRRTMDYVQLELISEEPTTARPSPPLLFVHGMWHGAWCWQEHFLPYFAQRGYSCTAVSMRGHGGSPGRERLRRTRVRDLVADVESVAAGLPEPPILIGHSLGGFVVQKYLETRTSPGAVLLAPAPPTGVVPVMLKTVRHYPGPFLKANAQLRLGPLVATPELARASFFSPSLPQDDVVRYQRQLGDDSYFTFVDMLGLDLVRRKRVRPTPMLVLGAEDDAMFSPAEIRRTGLGYGAQTEIVPGIAHDMMLDTRWEAVAERIAQWLDEQYPQK